MGHIRKANPSQKQIGLAKEYGVNFLPPGYTFVRPHQKLIGTIRDIPKYRSKSALKILYSSDFDDK